jgi:hypothetical protein
MELGRLWGWLLFEEGLWPAGRAHCAWGDHFVIVDPLRVGASVGRDRESPYRPSGGSGRSRYTPHEVGAARAGLPVRQRTIFLL